MTLEELKKFYGKEVWLFSDLQLCLVTITSSVSSTMDGYVWVKNEVDEWVEPFYNLYLTKEEAKEAALKEIEEKINKYKKLKQDLLND